MYAVIKTGGKQYRVAKGDKIFVEKLEGNVGDAVSFDQVLLLGGDAIKLGKPLVSGAKVEAKILEHGRGEKVIIFKFRRRKNYRRKTGHRQPFTTPSTSAKSVKSFARPTFLPAWIVLPTWRTRIAPALTFSPP